MKSIEELFCEKHNRPISHRTMTPAKFITLRRMLRFDNHNTRNTKLPRDILAVVRVLLNPLSTSKKMYILYQWVKLTPVKDSYVRDVFAVLFLTFAYLALNK